MLLVSLAGGQTPAAAESPVEVSSPDGQAIAYDLSRIAEDGRKLTFVVDASSPVRIRVAPQRFAIRRGEECSVNTSYFGPSIVRAERDGELTFGLDVPRNCTVVVEPLPGHNLVEDPGFESSVEGGPPAGWEDRGEPAGSGRRAGEIRISSGSPRSGERLLRMKHFSAFGLTALRTRAAMPLEPGGRYLVSVQYRAPRTPFGAKLLLMAEIRGADSPERYVRDEEPFVATRSGEWRRAFKTVAVSAGEREVTARLWLGLSGAAVEVDFDDVELRRAPSPAEQFSKPLPLERRTPSLARAAVEEAWKARSPVAVESPHDGGPLRLDGRIEPLYWLASDYWPGAWTAKTAHRDFAEAGVRVQAIPAHSWCRAGGGAWIADGVYDFASLDASLAHVLGLDDSSRAILYATVEPYPEFCDRHPDAAWVDGKGSRLVGEKEGARDAATRRAGEALAHSLTAPAYREGGCEYLRALAKHLRDSALGKAVVGLHIVAGTDGQWFKPDWRPEAGDYDYSEGGTSAFRDWLRRRYGGEVAALREAWADASLTFETACLPAESARSPAKPFLDPSSGPDRRIIDANLFTEAGKMETLDAFARAFKEALGRPVLVTAYLHNKLHGNRFWMESPWLDGTVAVEEYALWRGLGNTGEIATYPASLRLHGKFFLQELDYRTENAETWGADAQEAARHELGITFGPEEGAAQLRRDLGASISQGGGAWHYCLMGNSWNHPRHLANIAEAAQAMASAARRKDGDEAAQMAVFFDEDTEHYATGRDLFGPLLRHHGYYGARYALGRSGVTWDSYLLSDLGHPRLPDYRLYLFLPAGGLTGDQVRFVRERLQRDGKVLWFAHHAGWFSPGGFRRTIRELTGMDITVDLEARGERRFVRTGSDPLSEGVEEIDHGFGGPLFYVDDPAATPLATLTGTDKVGLAVRRHRGWTAVYSALPGGFTPRLLRGLAREAGLAPIGPEDDVTCAGNGCIAIHALSDGVKTLRWSGARDVLDLDGGSVIARGAESVTLPMAARETRWFRLFSPTRAAGTPGAVPRSPLPRLCVSANRRFLVTEAGAPFFWMADTAWELFHRSSREEAMRYLGDRAAKGFTVVQAVALAELDGLKEPSREGFLPLVDGDPSRPDVKPGPSDDYWDFVETVTAAAEEKGIYIALLPTWGKYVTSGPFDGKVDGIFDEARARAYGEFVGRRLGDRRNIVWVLGGDKAPSTPEARAIWRAMAGGIAEGVSGKSDGDSVLMTYHTAGPGSASDHLHDETWLDVTSLQSSHGDRIVNWPMIETCRRRRPAKPVIDLESSYPGAWIRPEWLPEPLRAGMTSRGPANDDHARRAAYWAVFSGACGHTYGHNSIWQMYAPGRKAVLDPREYWFDALDAPSAFQMGYLRRLIESRPFITGAPAADLIVDPPVDPMEHVAVLRGDGYALVYTPTGRPVRVRLDGLPWEETDAWWFDPRTAGTSAAGRFPNAGAREFDPPGDPGEGRDWVLGLDDPRRGRRAPSDGAPPRPAGATGH